MASFYESFFAAGLPRNTSSGVVQDASTVLATDPNTLLPFEDESDVARLRIFRG